MRKVLGVLCIATIVAFAPTQGAMADTDLTPLIGGGKPKVEFGKDNSVMAKVLAFDKNLKYSALDRLRHVLAEKVRAAGFEFVAITVTRCIPRIGMYFTYMGSDCLIKATMVHNAAPITIKGSVVVPESVDVIIKKPFVSL